MTACECEELNQFSEASESSSEKILYKKRKLNLAVEPKKTQNFLGASHFRGKMRRLQVFFERALWRRKRNYSRFARANDRDFTGDCAARSTQGHAESNREKIFTYAK